MEWATVAQKDWAHGFQIQPGDVLVCDWYVHLLRKCRRQYGPTIDDGEAVGPGSMSIMRMKISVPFREYKMLCKKCYRSSYKCVQRGCVQDG